MANKGDIGFVRKQDYYSMPNATHINIANSFGLSRKNTSTSIVVHVVASVTSGIATLNNSMGTPIGYTAVGASGDIYFYDLDDGTYYINVADQPIKWKVVISSGIVTTTIIGPATGFVSIL